MYLQIASILFNTDLQNINVQKYTAVVGYINAVLHSYLVPNMRIHMNGYFPINTGMHWKRLITGSNFDRTGYLYKRLVQKWPK